MQKQANTANPNHRWMSAVSGLAVAVSLAMAAPAAFAQQSGSKAAEGKEPPAATIDAATGKALNTAIEALCDNPRPAGVKALTGSADLLRIRVGDWRVIYRVADHRLVVVVVEVGHRREVYREK